MLGPDKGAQQRAAASTPGPSGGASQVLPIAGGALGAVIGGFAGNPLLGAQLGMQGGGIAGSAIDGDGLSPDQVVDFALKAKRGLGGTPSPEDLAANKAADDIMGAL